MSPPKKPSTATMMAETKTPVWPLTPPKNPPRKPYMNPTMTAIPANTV
eukprot:CAMPEP_0197031054 /NCGR_PEP_ID=MMETSP1384-20130603/10166_1 /TAXON_ID=29189 /ORGANISM="Ammonia sp." /LENGTH=47 /DNA_ID= /DNA_START= /DNA_END= /DNA_ORIENTATION=